jgi:hypothetical protein
LGKQLPMRSGMRTTRIAFFAVRRGRTTKGYARHRLCRACACARQRAPGSFLPGKELCRALWKRQRTAQYVAVRNT